MTGQLADFRVVMMGGAEDEDALTAHKWQANGGEGQPAARLSSNTEEVCGRHKSATLCWIDTDMSSGIMCLNP
jgi:hypothetical protein